MLDEYTDTCIAGGVEIQGLHATVAPRRQHQHAPPILEEFQFVPYIDRKLPGDLGDLMEYEAVCNAYIHKELSKLLEYDTSLDNNIIRKLCSEVESDADVLDKVTDLLSKPGTEYLRRLQDIFSISADEHFSSNVDNLNSSWESCSSISESMVEDVIRTEILKPCLDIVVENILSSKVKVVEMMGSDVSDVSEDIVALLSTHPLVHVEYAVCSNKLADGDQLQLKEDQISHVEWNAEIAECPSSLKGSHLVVARNFLHTHANISTVLQKISDLLVDNGFLLVQETTTNFLSSFAMEYLGHHHDSLSEFPVTSSDRKCLCYLDNDQWEVLFEKEGFEIVFSRVDNFQSTLFLLRKVAVNSRERMTQEILSVEGTNCEWVEKLKTKVSEYQGRPKGDNLWLTVNETRYSGILGLVNCLRQEPGGDRIR